MSLRLIASTPSPETNEPRPIGVDQRLGLRVGSLFPGYGGLDAGVRDVLGAGVAWHAESNTAAARVLAHHHPQTPNLGDVTGIDWSAVEPVDVLVAGYPCQPFSTAGKRRGAADDRYLWPHVAEAVRVLAPEFVVLENVRGHVGLGFSRVVGEMAGLGYDTRWMCLRACDVGAPHQRNRLFALATRTAAGAGSAAVAANTGGVQFQRGRVAVDLAGPCLQPDQRWEDAAVGDLVSADFDRWGPFTVAVRRWETILGRPAPEPSELNQRGQRRLSAAFVEWMMGLPTGHVTGVPGLTRAAQLRLLGNGVVPRQAGFALRHLLQATPPTAVDGRAERVEASDRQDESGLGVAA